ncbi:unnamed protein product [Phaedon cochleariae]|uniref:Uncharacterized protein n=1 Tax=Phaedon cochleariae TaxID=80249 RepID=A0A9P0DR17_PHACE|nr:unnamed protein product [Phaedon cochleariae]
MPRTTDLLAEETAPVSSPLRRSSRIVAVNIPPAEVSKPSKTRRSSVSQENNDDEKAEAKLVRGRRAASITKEDPPPKPEPAKTRARRNSATTEPKEEPKLEPAKPRSRRSSVTTEPKENEVKRQPVGRRRSSATEDLETEQAKQTKEETLTRTLRGRRGSVQEDKPPEEDTNVRPTRSTRSASREVSLEPEEKKPATRGRRKSVDAQETESVEKKPVRTRRSSTDKLDGEPEVKLAKIAPTKPKRRLSITENAINLAPIEEQEGERKSLSPVPNKSSETIQLTPIKKKQEAAKAELDLSIINETSFVEENVDDKVTEVVVEVIEDSNEEAASRQPPEEKITTPKKSPRFRNSKSPTEVNNLKHEDTPTEKNRAKSPATPKKSPRILISQEQTVEKPKEDTENLAVEESSAPRKSPRIQAKARKSDSPGDHTKNESIQGATTENLDNNQSDASKEPPQEELNIEGDSVSKSDSPVSAELKKKELTYTSTGSDKSSGATTENLDNNQSDTSKETPQEDLNIEDDSVFKSDSPASAEIKKKESEEPLQKKSNVENDTVFKPEPPVSVELKKKESTYISTGSDDSFQFHLSDTRLESTSQEDEVDDLNTSKTSNSSDKENVAINVDDSMNQSKITAKTEIMKTLVNEKETMFEQNQVIARVSNVFRPKNIDFSFVEPMEVDKTGIDLDTTNFDKTVNESKLLASIPDESVDESFNLQLDVTKMESPNKSTKLTEPEIVEETKEVSAAGNLEKTFDKSPRVSSSELVVDVSDDSIVIVEDVDVDQSTVSKAAEMSVILEETANTTCTLECSKLATDESYIGISKKVDMSQDYEFDLPSEEDNEEMEKTHLLDTSKVNESEAITKPAKTDSIETSLNKSVSGEIELITREKINETEVIQDQPDLTVVEVKESNLSISKEQEENEIEAEAAKIEHQEKTDLKSKDADDVEIEAHASVKKNIDEKIQIIQDAPSEPDKDESLKLEDLEMEAHHVTEKGINVTISAADSTKDDICLDSEEKVLDKSATKNLSEEVTEQSKCIPVETSPQPTKDNKSNTSNLHDETSVNDTDNQDNTNIETQIDEGGEEEKAAEVEEMEKSFQDVLKEDGSIDVPKVEAIVELSNETTTDEPSEIPKENEEHSPLTETHDLNTSRKKKKGANKKLNESVAQEPERSNKEPENKSEETVATDTEKNHFNLFKFFKQDGTSDQDPESPKPEDKSSESNQNEVPKQTEHHLQESPRKKKKSKSKQLELPDGQTKIQPPQKTVSLEEFTNSKLDEFISRKMAEMEDELESSDPDDEEPSDSGDEGSSDSAEEESEDGDFLDTMAEEGEEDTPSDDSNQIVDEGESIHSESDQETEDEYDSNDSFICDNDKIELLPGEEYDLEDTKHKKRKSRIINVENIESDVITIERKEKPVKPKRKSRIISVSSSSEEDIEVDPTAESPTIETKEDIVPSTSQLMSDQGSSRRRSSSSITIIENINVQDIKDTALSERIHSLVDNFCTTIPKKGDISMNLSLEYARKSSSEDSLCSEKPEIKSTIVAQKSPKVVQKAPKAEETGGKRRSVKRTSSSYEEESPSKKGRLSTSLEDLNDDTQKHTPKRRLSQSLEELETKKRKKKTKKAKKAKEEAPSKRRRSSSEGDLQTQTFSLMNQLITDVRNRPKRVIKPTTSKPDASESWVIDVADMKPSTSIVTRREMENFKKNKRHPKDFRNEMLYDSSRVKRMDTKTLLKKKGAYY